MADLKTKTLSNLETITSLDDNDKVLIERGGDIIKVNASSVKSQDLNDLDEYNALGNNDTVLAERNGEMIRINQAAVKTPDLGSLETVNSLSDGDKILVNVNGEMKQINGNEIGGQEVYIVNYYMTERDSAYFDDPPYFKSQSLYSDHTIDEIQAAVDDGKLVIAHLFVKVQNSDGNIIYGYDSFIPLLNIGGSHAYYLNHDEILEHSSDGIYYDRDYIQPIVYYLDDDNNITCANSSNFVRHLLDSSYFRAPSFVFESKVYDLIYDDGINTIKLQNVEYDFSKDEVTVSIIEHNSDNEISMNELTFSLVREATA